MATILLSAIGGAIGTSVGGSVLGLGAAVIGRAIGGTIGNVIDHALLGGSEPVEHGKVDTLRIQGSGEGKPVAQVYGRMRVAGHVIWSSRFQENVATSGGKGMGGPKARNYSYSISIAVALCEGEVARIGRVWADGKRLDLSGITMRLHKGSETQMPDPVIEALEGAAPAYRGTAYVVLEDLDLTPFGNRIPQFNFEVVRPAAGSDDQPRDLVNAVALIPGTGEYALATEPVHYPQGKGVNRAANTNNLSGLTDVEAALEQLDGDLPHVESVSLVVSWFGDDLRCNTCTISPRVEQADTDGDPMPWQVSGVGRGGAALVSRDDADRPNFGGTPCDKSVLQSIAQIKAMGKAVMFYPFILMDIPAGNGLINPYGGAEQPVFPWRGRMTASLAPGQAGTPDKTAAAGTEVDAFFGSAAVGDFSDTANGVTYTGPIEWSYRRFILHYAHLCAKAGGVESFCIGSELRGLTTLRDGVDSFPVVAALQALAADVRTILPDAKIGYAADWSEYFGYHPDDGSGDLLFHLDPLWADDNIDFIGIDNYMPLSDWRDTDEQLDKAKSIYDLDYLTGNIRGGEGFDWYYANAEARELQVRSPITDGAYEEPWVYRYKDILNWWQHGHANRIGGVREAAYTPWLPRSKPIWFTEIGCPAVDKGTNQPNVFIDPKSSESFYPYHSTGGRDDAIQNAYLRAMYRFWNDPDNNPESPEYAGRMVDMTRAHVWAWDARPWPDFPNRLSVWSDGDNYRRGHWLSGRASAAALGEVVREICARSKVYDVDTTDLYAMVDGAVFDSNETARAALQPLILAYGVECHERNGQLVFSTRDGVAQVRLGPDDLAVEGEDPALSLTRNPDAEVSARVRIGYYQADNDYQSGASEAGYPDETQPKITTSALPLALTSGQAHAVAARWLAEARVARDSLEFSLPPSRMMLGAGDVVEMAEGEVLTSYRIDKVEDTGLRKITATRVEAGVYRPELAEDRHYEYGGITASGPVYAEFMDLPLLRGDEVPHAPHMAVTATPWPGEVAVYDANTDAGYNLLDTVPNRATMGVFLDDLPRADPARWSRASVRVRLVSGTLQSKSTLDVLNGANLMAVRNGSGDWEVMQFRDATLIGPNEYRLSNLLRGQAGTDGIMPDLWPAGTDLVVLDGAQVQLDLQSSQRDMLRHYRIGPASLSYDSPRYMHLETSFAGVGLRPYPIAHLKKDGNKYTWIRRTRIDGDSWAGLDVPLGEESESYHIRVIKDGVQLREKTKGSPVWFYTNSKQTADGVTKPYHIEVAQISASFGPGPYTRITIND